MHSETVEARHAACSRVKTAATARTQQRCGQQQTCNKTVSSCLAAAETDRHHLSCMTSWQTTQPGVYVTCNELLHCCTPCSTCFDITSSSSSHRLLNSHNFTSSYVSFSFHFYRALLCVGAVFAVARCPSVCLSVRPSVCHVGTLYPHGWRYCQTSLSVG